MPWDGCNCQYESYWDEASKTTKVRRIPSGDCPDHGAN